MAHFEIFRKNMFLKKNSFNFLCVNFDTLYTKYTFNMAKCQNLLFLLVPAAGWPIYPPKVAHIAPLSGPYSAQVAHMPP